MSIRRSRGSDSCFFATIGYYTAAHYICGTLLLFLVLLGYIRNQGDFGVCTGAHLTLLKCQAGARSAAAKKGRSQVGESVVVEQDRKGMTVQLAAGRSMKRLARMPVLLQDWQGRSRLRLNKSDGAPAQYLDCEQNAYCLQP